MPDLIIPVEMPSLEAIKEHIAGYPNLDAAAIHAINELLKTSRVVEGELNKGLAAHGLTMGRHVTLWCIAINGAGPEGILPAEIADRLGVTRATVTGLLDGLEREGLIVRQRRTDDARKVNVMLTDAARRKIEEVWPVHYGHISSAMQVLNEREKLQLVKLLRKVRERASHIAGEGAPEDEA